MKRSSLLPGFALTVALACAATLSSFAQDTTPPVVANPIGDVTVSVNSAPTVIKLKKTFALNGVTGDLYRFSTNAGNVDVEMLAQSAPNTVATFLTYATAAGDNTPGNYSYNHTLIQRAVPGFIVQGGGFFVDASSQINQILGRPAIASEAGVKNTRGTLAMALSTGPNSATGDFFFNVADNAILDGTDDGGPFTVFGRVVGSLATLDAIEALPQENFSNQLGGSFENVPLVNYNGSSAGIENLVYLNSVTLLPLTAKSPDAAGALVVTVKGNTNPDLVTATLHARKLTLTYAPGKTGTAKIKLLARNPITGSRIITKVKVTVQ